MCLSIDKVTLTPTSRFEKDFNGIQQPLPRVSIETQVETALQQTFYGLSNTKWVIWSAQTGRLKGRPLQWTRDSPGMVTPPPWALLNQIKFTVV